MNLDGFTKAIFNAALDEGSHFIIKKATSELMEDLIKKFAFLATGPMGWLVTYAVTKGVTFLVTKGVLGAHLMYIYGDAKLDGHNFKKTIKSIRELKKGGMTNEQRKSINAELVANAREYFRMG